MNGILVKRLLILELSFTLLQSISYLFMGNVGVNETILAET